MMHTSRQIFLSGLAGAVLCLGADSAALAQDVFFRPAMEDFIDKDTMLAFPAAIDSFQKVRVRRNENPVFGTVVRYENEAGACADVYIYSLDTGAKTVTEAQYRKHFEETCTGILDMPGQNAKIRSVSKLKTPDGRKPPAFGQETMFRIQSGSTIMDSVLYMALYHGKLIKLRISYSPDDAGESAHAYAFVDRICVMLTGKSIRKNEPAEAKAEPKKAEPVKAEAAKPEPKKTEPVKAEPPKTEPAGKKP